MQSAASTISVSGTVAIGVMHQEGGFTFDRPYYFDPEHRWAQDVRIARWCEETYAPYPIHNAEAHLIQLDQLPRPFRMIGALQPNLILGAAVGAEFRFFGDQDPDITPYPLQALDSIDDVRRLGEIRWSEVEPVCTFLDQIDASRAKFEGRPVDVIPPFFWDLSGRATIHGPLTTAHKLMGEGFFMKLLDDPDMAVAFLDWIGDAYITLIKLFSERADHPLTGIHIGECSGCLFSPSQWEMALPVMNRLVEACGECRIHSCGNSDHLVELMAQVKNIRNFNVGTGTDVSRCRELIGNEIQLDVIPDPELLTFAKPEEVGSWVDRTLDENSGGPMEIQFHLDAAVPPANARAIFDACAERGIELLGDPMPQRWTGTESDSELRAGP